MSAASYVLLGRYEHLRDTGVEFDVKFLILKKREAGDYVLSVSHGDETQEIAFPRQGLAEFAAEITRLLAHEELPATPTTTGGDPSVR